MRSRLKFLMELVLDYNETHVLTKATFRMNGEGILLYVEADGEISARMIEDYSFKDVTEEAVYEIYKKMTAVTEQSTADEDDAPNGQS